jgi:hypothetical protein
MLAQEDTPLPEGPGLPLDGAADLQDDLMVVTNDMERLQRLLSDACDTLLTHFYGATGEIKNLLHRVASHPEVDAHELHAPWNTWPAPSPRCSSRTWPRS